MDNITKQEEFNERQEHVFKTIDPILQDLDQIMPPTWNKNQVAAVFTVYLEIYR